VIARQALTRVAAAARHHPAHLLPARVEAGGRRCDGDDIDGRVPAERGGNCGNALDALAVVKKPAPLASTREILPQRVLAGDGARGERGQFGAFKVVFQRRRFERRQSGLAGRGGIEAADGIADADHEPQRVRRLEGQQIVGAGSRRAGQNHRLVQRVAQGAKQLAGARQNRVVVGEHLAQVLDAERWVVAPPRGDLIEIAPRLHGLQNIVTARYRDVQQAGDVRERQRAFLPSEKLQQIKRAFNDFRHSPAIKFRCDEASIARAMVKPKRMRKDGPSAAVAMSSIMQNYKELMKDLGAAKISLSRRYIR
jgi:hypothetical protein